MKLSVADEAVTPDPVGTVQQNSGIWHSSLVVKASCPQGSVLCSMVLRYGAEQNLSCLCLQPNGQQTHSPLKTKGIGSNSVRQFLDFLSGETSHIMEDLYSNCVHLGKIPALGLDVAFHQHVTGYFESAFIPFYLAIFHQGFSKELNYLLLLLLCRSLFFPIFFFSNYNFLWLVFLLYHLHITPVQYSC